MSAFSAKQQATLALVCETFIPKLTPNAEDDPVLFSTSAADMDTLTLMLKALDVAADAKGLFELGLFLRTLENGLANRLISGHDKPFSKLSQKDREAVLLAWGHSRYGFMRKAFQSVKRLSLALFYTARPNGQPNPATAAFNYPAPPTPSQNTPRPIQPLAPTTATTLYTDVLIIGSGAGGGVVAGELSAAGADVIVVEKGGYYAESDFNGQEALGNETLYERGGLLTSVDMAFSVLAGSVLGGGTTINWTASIPTPENVLAEWARDYGFSATAQPEYQASARAVAERIHVTEDYSQANPQNALLEKGCTALGHTVKPIARNAKGCGECGFCGYGCVEGAKQSTLKTYLQDAYDRGARILTHARVEKVLHQAGVAQGAEVIYTTAQEEKIAVTIKAKIVVAAAGAIHTPALLLRSGLGNAHIGANLHLHPVTAVFSRFDSPVRGWHGAPMTRVSFALSDLDGHGYGVWLETAPNHPGIAAQAFPWTSGRNHKQEMQHLENYANIIILTRDMDGGQVKVAKDGEPRLHYHLSAYDERHLMIGLIEALKAHRAAGATHIYGPHNHIAGYVAGGDQPFDAFLAQVQTAGLKANAAALFSAHQMSSCRIGGSSAIGAISPAGESYEVRNLFVADGSSLPTAVGVNPMLSIMTAAHYIAQQIKTRL